MSATTARIPPRRTDSDAASEGADALVLDGVTAGYGRSLVLRDVSLRVGHGEAVALLGPNGAGKTTLLRVASGLLRPTAGEVGLRGHRAGSWPASRRARSGLCHIPEGRGIFPSLSVRENLVVQAGAASAAIDRAIDAFPRLRERLDQRAGTLSGGEQQMLAMARAYARDPSLVLVDEPSLGLAPNLVDEVFEFLAEVVRRGSALLVVEQYVPRALALASRIYVLRKGRIDGEHAASDVDADQISATYLSQSTDTREPRS
ncbi:MAG TPA: ABC transporter ATP-binding protein [Acidimicrobiales bacterium]